MPSIGVGVETVARGAEGAVAAEVAAVVEVAAEVEVEVEVEAGVVDHQAA